MIAYETVDGLSLCAVAAPTAAPAADRPISLSAPPVFLPPTLIASYTLQAPSRSEVAWAGMLAGGLERKGAKTSASPSRRGAWDAVVSRSLRNRYGSPVHAHGPPHAHAVRPWRNLRRPGSERDRAFFMPLTSVPLRGHRSRPAPAHSLALPAQHPPGAYFRYHQHQLGASHNDTIAPQPPSEDLPIPME